MVLTEYDEQAVMQSIREESKIEGKIEGKIEECIRNIKNLMINGNYSFEKASELLGYTLEEVLPYKDQIIQTYTA